MDTNIYPQVAIITRTKNRPVFLERCLTTVVNQTFQDWIHVIVNDGGDAAAVDALVEARAPAYQGRIKVLHNNESQGMEAASNRGIQNSESRYIVILDDDDTWHPDFLKQCIERLLHKRHPNVAGVVSHSIKVHEAIHNNAGSEAVIETSREPFQQHMITISLSELAGSNIFPVNSFVYEREALKKVGPYREDLPVLGDWEFNLRFVLYYDIDVIPIPLSFFHNRPGTNAGDYANSVVAGLREHLFYRTLIQNEYLRKDMQSNKPGLGTIMSMNAGYKEMNVRINAICGRINIVEERLLFFRTLQWLKRKIFSSKRKR